MKQDRVAQADGATSADAGRAGHSAGKSPLTSGAGAVQRKESLASALGGEDMHDKAAAGVSGGGGALPFGDQIQQAFGHHDISDVRGHVGGAATEASEAIGAKAYATGKDVAFGGAPDLHTAAHEAAHVVQQRAGVQLKGGVGEAGDHYERHADAVADRVVAGGSATALLDQVAPARGGGGGGGGGGGVQKLQLALAADLRTASGATPFDPARVLALIAAAPVAEVTAVASNRALIHQIETKMAAQADSVRARLARRLMIDGNHPIQAWALITGDSRARRQQYLDAYGTVAEQRALEDAVITNGSNTGYMIRAFDSYWEVEATRQAGSRWNTQVIQAMQRQLKLLPDGDVRAQDVNGRVWQKIVLSVDPALIDRAAFGGGEFIVGAHAATTFTNPMGYGTKLTAAAARGAHQLTVNEGTRLAVGDTIALGTAGSTVSVDPKYDRVNVTAIAGNTVTIGSALAHAHAVDDTVTKIDAHGGSVKLTGAAARGATTLQVSDGTHFAVNDGFELGTGTHTAAGDAKYDHGTVTAIAGNVLTISSALAHNHATDDVVARTVTVGNHSALTAAVARGATQFTVGLGSSFAVNDQIAIGTGATPTSADRNFDWGRISAIAGNTLTVGRATLHTHAIGDVIVRMDERGSGARDTNWLNGTVRHEIAHAVDAAIPTVVTGFTAGIGGWWTGAQPATEGDFDAWASAMGNGWHGATSGAAGATTPITAADKATIRTVITTSVANAAGSLFAQGLAAAHPIMRNRHNNVPVIMAAEACLSRGDGFYQSPEALYANGGKVFSVSNWYRNFMYHNETIRQSRLSDYSLYAPAEFFAETYTVYYEEAGRPGVQESDYGRLIADGTQRNWIKTHIHDRHHAPAGAVGGGGGHGPGPEGAPGGAGAEGGGERVAGVQPGGGGTGKKSHQPW